MTCTTCGHGTRVEKWGRQVCSYCGDDFPTDRHRHKLGGRISGLARCVGHRYLGCDYSDYDSSWGAGIFSDWPVGHHKAYGE